jgi:hypothetical protein
MAKHTGFPRSIFDDDDVFDFGHVKDDVLGFPGWGGRDDRVMMIMDTITTKGEATTTMMIMGTITTTGRNLSLRCPTTRQPFLTASRPET